MKKQMLVAGVLCFVWVCWNLYAQVCTQPPVVDVAQFGIDANEVPVPVIAWQVVDPLGDYGSEVRACDEDGNPYSIEPVQMADGAVWNPEISTWFWTPTLEQIGNHIFIFRVRDTPDPNWQTGDAGTDEAAFAIIVRRRPNRPPRLLPFLAP